MWAYLVAWLATRFVGGVSYNSSTPSAHNSAFMHSKALAVHSRPSGCVLLGMRKQACGQHTLQVATVGHRISAIDEAFACLIGKASVCVSS
jgi:hypothetical protein